MYTPQTHPKTHTRARREGIEDVVLSKRRFTYEQEVAANPLNYDAWFDYIKLEESTGSVERTREVRARVVLCLRLCLCLCVCVGLRVFVCVCVCVCVWSSERG
jgi:hypothetical protein